MATAQPKPVRVKLTYDFDHDTLATIPEKPVLKPGTHVEFYSDQGKVKVLLAPEKAFRPHTFTEGDPPVQVVKPFKNGMIWCGGTFKRQGQGIASPPIEIDIDPAKKKWGSQPIDH